jgi:hypothetical protein
MNADTGNDNDNDNNNPAVKELRRLLTRSTELKRFLYCALLIWKPEEAR